MPDNTNVPPIRDAGAGSVPESDDRGLLNKEAQRQGEAPKTSGAPERGREPLVDKLADRNTDGVRQAGTTPDRPTSRLSGANAAPDAACISARR